MTNLLSQQRCFNHRPREAAAKCLGCGRFYCRECITEHKAQLLCSKCLRESVTAFQAKRPAFGGPVRLGQLFGGLVIIWLVFYYLGDFLLTLPSSFHEGSLWHSGWWTD